MKKTNLLGSYKNGNYTVSLYSDGTKIRENDLDNLTPSFPENIDLKITNYCDAGCLYCHEDSIKLGLHGDLNVDFINTLSPFTELAIGGGNPLDHPFLIPFLYKLKERNIIANLTINQIHFERKQLLIKDIVSKGLAHGIGVSMIKPSDNFISLIDKYENAIIHTINGVTSLDHYKKLSNKGIKILVLGYKHLRRGLKFYSPSVEKNMSELSENIMILSKGFPIISFDNLALNQLNMKSKLPNQYWEEFYMGDDGKYTMYVDLVTREFSKSSTCMERYPIADNIDTMFKKVLTIQ
jgi:hypothetical protein